MRVRCSVQVSDDRIGSHGVMYHLGAYATMKWTSSKSLVVSISPTCKARCQRGLRGLGTDNGPDIISDRPRGWPDEGLETPWCCEYPSRIEVARNPAPFLRIVKTLAHGTEQMLFATWRDRVSLPCMDRLGVSDVLTNMHSVHCCHVLRCYLTCPLLWSTDLWMVKH